MCEYYHSFLRLLPLTLVAIQVQIKYAQNRISDTYEIYIRKIYKKSNNKVIDAQFQLKTTRYSIL